MTEEKNAVIESAVIEIEDHGMLTAWLHLSYYAGGQGFGGYALYQPAQPLRENGQNYAGHFISRCLQIGGVSQWEKLPGKTLRVRADHGKVHAIGHIVKDDWFYPSEDFKEQP